MRRRGKKPGLFSAWWLRWPLAAGFVACAVLLIAQNRRFEDQKSYAANRSLPAVPAPSVNAPTMTAASAPPPPKVSAAPPAASMFKAVAADNLTRNDSQQMFQNVAAQAPPAEVLNSFQVKREGNQVLVTDADGSVYTGAVVPPVQTGASKAKPGFGGAARAMETQAGRASAAATAPEGDGYSFAVRGVNNRVRQAVHFNGRFTATPLTNNSLSNFQNQGQSARVSGVATVGATNQIQVDATPSP